MAILGLILMVIGGLASTVFGIILLVKAFQESVLWGLGYIFIPFVALIFVVKFWDQTKKPFLYSVAATVVMCIGVAFSGMSASSEMNMQQANVSHIAE